MPINITATTKVYSDFVVVDDYIVTEHISIGDFAGIGNVGVVEFSSSSIHALTYELVGIDPGIISVGPDGRIYSVDFATLYALGIDSVLLKVSNSSLSWVQSIRINHDLSGVVPPGAEPFVPAPYINGTEGADNIVGTDIDNVIDGRGGDDIIDAGAGDNNVNGGDGNDTIVAGSGSDYVTGGDGNDIIDVGHGANYVMAGDGDDQVTAGDGNDVVYGGLGDDEISTGGGVDFAYGDEGDDVIHLGDGNDQGSGGMGSDEIHGGTGNDRVWCDDDGDVLHGDEGNDEIDGGEGEDRIHGGAGRDTLYGGSGADVFVFASASESPLAAFDIQNYEADGASGILGVDVIGDYTAEDSFDLTGFGPLTWASNASSNPGAAIVTVVMRTDNYGGMLFVDADRDGLQDFAVEFQSWSSPLSVVKVVGLTDFTVDSPPSNPNIVGTNGNDTIVGTRFSDYITGRNGNDDIDAKGGNNSVSGGEGNDVITAGSGADALYGDNGNDHISGGAGTDVIDGGYGDDTIIGGAGYDQLYGGEGSDTFVFSKVSDSAINGQDLSGYEDRPSPGNLGLDIIQDLSADDVIDLSGFGPLSWDVNGPSNTGLVKLRLVDGKMGGVVLIDTNRDGQEDFGFEFSHITGAGTVQFTGIADYVGEQPPASPYQNGTNASETFTGTGFADQIYAQGGNDTIHSLGGPDHIDGGAGVDTIYAGDGRDTVYGGLGNDYIDGGAGADNLYGGDNNDTILGGVGNDAIYGEAGTDTLKGEAGNDTIYGGLGNDLITGGLGADQISGEAGTDRFIYTSFEDSRIVSYDKSEYAAGYWNGLVGADHIMDYAQGEIIDLAALGTLSWIANPATAPAGSALVSVVTDGNRYSAALFIDQDRDGLQDFAIEIDLSGTVSRLKFAGLTDYVF